MIIGLYSSQPQSGKTTAAEALVGIGYEQCKFAGPMYYMTYALFKYMDIPEDSIEHFMNEGKNEKIGGLDCSFREFMQKLGTDFGRDIISEKLWIGLAALKVNALGSNGQKDIVFDDLRFQNEYDYLKGINGKIIKLVNKDVVCDTANDHKSEGNLDDFDFDAIVENKGTIEDLQNEIVTLARSFEDQSGNVAEE